MPAFAVFGRYGEGQSVGIAKGAVLASGPSLPDPATMRSSTQALARIHGLKMDLKMLAVTGFRWNSLE
jgi:hypothetical protein